MNRWVWIAAGAAVLAAGGYFGYDALVKEQPALAVQQRTAAVSRGELIVSVTGSGTVSTVNKEQVTAGEAGKLEQVLVAAGDTVAAGQVLAVFEAPDVTAEIRQKENALKKQEMQLEQSKEQYIAAADDSARKQAANSIESLKLDIESSQLDLAELREQQRNVTQIVSPIAGKVTAVEVAAGEQVQPEAVIASIVDYDNLQSVIQVDELDIPKIKLGQAAAITLDALENVEIQGEVTAIADEGVATNGVSVFDVTVSYRTVDNVKSGMTAQAEIRIEQKTDALLLPIEAVRDMGGRKMVILAGESGQRDALPEAPGLKDPASAPAGEAPASGSVSPEDATVSAPGQRRGMGGSMGGNLREVTVGIYNESYIEIVSGLSEGDIVVLPDVVASSSNAGMPAGMDVSFQGAGAGGFAGGGRDGGMRQFGGGQGGGGPRG